MYMQVFSSSRYETHDGNLRASNSASYITPARPSHSRSGQEEGLDAQTSCMNDYMEIEHGLNCVEQASKGKHGQRLKSFLDGMFPGISTEIEQKYAATKGQLSR